MLASDNGDDNIVKALDYQKQGDKYYDEMKYDLAVDAYRKSLATGYMSRSAIGNLGNIYHFNTREYAKSENIFKKGIEIYPEDNLFHYGLSQLYFATDRLEEAMGEYALSVKYKQGLPQSPANTRQIKAILKKRGKTEFEIIEYIKSVIKINPYDYFAKFELAEYNKKNKEYAKALKEYKEVLAINNNQARAYRGMGTCYYNLGDKQLSLESFTKAKSMGVRVPDEFFEKLTKELHQKQ